MMHSKGNAGQALWKTPVFPKIPMQVAGCDVCAIPLSKRSAQDWKFCFQKIEGVPSAYADKQDFNFDAIPEDCFSPVAVPGSLIMQGFDIENNTEYYYKRTIQIPAAFQDKRVLLRFEGVYSHARVWINNVFQQSHIGGFTVWDCDISAFATCAEVTLVVGVSDIEGETRGVWNPGGQRVSDSAWASYYAHCNISGILRDVTLFTLPTDYIARTHLHTTLHDAYQSGTLQLDFEIHASRADLIVKTELLDAQDVPVAQEDVALDASCQRAPSAEAPSWRMQPKTLWKIKNRKSFANDRAYESLYFDKAKDRPAGLNVYHRAVSIAVRNPLLWDAEHPNLYKLRVTLLAGEHMLQVNTHVFGFREILYGGKNNTAANKLYVNGKEIKLRGVCRHDVSHMYGRSLTQEDIEQEILIYKQHNINHIRTSHYPASAYMLTVCDRLGIYVEQENAACFKGANSSGIYNAPQDFVQTFAEMMESGRNHPSVIIWSLANESGFEKTAAFRTEFNYAKQADPSRPVIFSYPFTVHSKPNPYDIYSKHYMKVTAQLGKRDIPMLHDEFAHVPCYNIENLKADNSSRDFWGESIQKGWNRIFETDGALGCAIWGAIDDVFYIPEGTCERHQSHSVGSCAGYGEWGAILDAYKRLKPEAYYTKKAFTPILLDEKKSTLGSTVTLFLKNRFDHTSLAEVTMRCVNETGETVYDGLIPTDIAPHQSGTVQFPVAPSKSLHISFFSGGHLVDAYALSKFESKQQICNQVPARFEIWKTKNEMLLKTADNTPVAIGPHFYWKGQKAACSLSHYTDTTEGKKTQISAVLLCKKKPLFRLHMLLENDRLRVSLLPLHSKINLADLTIGFSLPNAVQAVHWEKDALYTVYPDNHIGRRRGTAYVARQQGGVQRYGEKPDWAWEEDMANYFLFQKDDKRNAVATNDFKTKRNSIHTYAVQFEPEIPSLTVLADTNNINAYVQMFSQNGVGVPELQISAGKYYPDIQWGNYIGEKPKLEKGEALSFSLQLEDDRENRC